MAYRIGVRNREELLNSITHGIGLTLSVAGAPLLVILAALRGTAWHVVSVSVYTASLIVLYACSTLYHSFPESAWKELLRVADHSAIYLLIAGTYTPFTLVNLHGEWGWSLFAAVWVLAVIGITAKVLLIERFARLSIALYVITGWLAVVALKPLLQHVALGGVIWIVAGGVCYTGGLIFFGWKRCPYNHSIWHVFVLAGSVCHYLAVMFYVVPAPVG